jgi:glycosyltransferase involved in cell wall biosynthesis
MPDLPKTIFLGLGSSVVAYYRCFLPAVALGLDYAVWGSANTGGLAFDGGFGDRPPRAEDLFDYDVVVVQYGSGKHWLKLTRELQDAGVTVLYEVDDYVHAARKNRTHELSALFGASRLREMEMVMRVVDGMICSTAYIARRYRAFNPRTWECRNGIDLKRYEWPRPAHSGVTIGWAGGVGHKASLARWEPALRAVLRARPEARFVSVGHFAAEAYVEEFGRERVHSWPTAGIEVYPATMTLFDLAIAPSAENNQFRGKSDLRWLEASAVGIPLVAHPDVYPDIEDGVTGVHAATVEDVEAALLRLIDNPSERERIGANAHEHVAGHRRIELAARAWREVLTGVATPVVF